MFSSTPLADGFVPQALMASAITDWLSNVWAIVLMAIATLPLTHDERATNPLRLNAQRLGTLTGGAPAYWYVPDAPDPAVLPYFGPDAPHPAVLLYAQRTLPRITDVQVKHVIEEQQPFYLICPMQMSAVADELTEVEALPRIDAKLWRFTPPDE